MSPSQALGVGLDVCRALDHAHRRRFVHSELTPSKIVWGDDRRLRIVDFGLAGLLGEKVWEQPDSVPNHVAWYAAPEQGLGEPVDGRADVYALGLALHEAVTGTLPFRSESTVATLSARVGRLMPVSADLGPLASVLERAGRPNAEERATAAEFGKGLLQAAAKLPRPEPLPLLSTGPVRHAGRATAQPRRSHRRGVPSRRFGAGAAGRAARRAGHRGSRSAGGVGRRAHRSAAGGPEPDPETDPQLPIAAPGEDLVILPLDAEQSPAGPVVSPEVRQPLATTQMPVVESESMPRRRRDFPWKILLGLVVLAALVTLGVLALRLFGTDTHLVPDLTAVPEAEAAT